MHNDAQCIRIAHDQRRVGFGLRLSRAKREIAKRPLPPSADVADAIEGVLGERAAAAEPRLRP